MRALALFSLLSSLIFKMIGNLLIINRKLKKFILKKPERSFQLCFLTSCKIIIPVCFFLLLSGFQAKAADTIVSVRFANPKYVCATQTYSLEVQFQCNIANMQLYGINVRFYYADEVLEFLSFGDIISTYKKSGTPSFQTGSDTSGTDFGFPGPWEYINGVIQIRYSSAPVLPTSGWLRVFNVNFHVDDPEVMNDPSFCPSVIWDKKESPAEGGFAEGSSGVVITLVRVFPNTTISTIEDVVHFNWQYNDDGDPDSPPYGFPIDDICISTLRTYAPTTYLPLCEFNSRGPVDIPVIVTNFTKIGHFNLVFEYDPAIMTYENNTPNSIFTSSNGLLYVNDSASTDGKNKITMKYQRVGNVALTLSDSSHLTDLHFTYISGSSDLTWKTTINSCHYVDSLLQAKCDQPYSDFYINGAVSPPSKLAPVTKIDSAVAVEYDYVTYSVRVWDFENIYSGFLTLTYEPDILEFYNVVPDAAITTNFDYDASVAGTIEMNWSGKDTCLTDGSILMYLTFMYLGGNAPLIWFDTGSSCQYTDSNNIPLLDNPAENFYINGSITSAEFIWTGENSGEWNNTENWEYNIIPNQFINVIIDPSSDPLNWPIFNGNFTLGENCKNLTLNENAQFTISGDFTINPGHTLNLNGSGIIQIGGDWINSGIFIPGSGTVEFTGTGDGSIAEGVPPGNYVAAYVLSTFTAGMTEIAGGSAGPAGDDAYTDVSIAFPFNYLGVNYSNVRINTNGWLSLDLTGDNTTSSDNTILFNTSAPTTALAPWWDDLNADEYTTIAYLTQGETPSRVFTAEWKNILAFNSEATARLNFQVKLYENTNIIEFCYGSVTGGTHNANEGASIGIKDATGGPGNFIEATQNSTNIVQAILKSNVNWPVENFRFSPPVEITEEIFNKVLISKESGKLYIQRDVRVTGLN